MSEKVAVHINEQAVIRERFNVFLSVQFVHMLECIRKDWWWFNHLDQHLVEFIAC